MLKKFLFIIATLFIVSCSNKSTSSKISNIKTNFVVPPKTEIHTTININEIIQPIAINLATLFKQLNSTIDQHINAKIPTCEHAVLILKPEWNEDFCDPLLNDKKEECVHGIKEAVPPFINQFCTLLAKESFRTGFDLLLAISVAKNESNFGVIKKDDAGNYYVSMNTNFISIKSQDIQEIYSKHIVLNNGRTINAKVISQNHRTTIADTGLAGEAGLFQLIRPNYYANRPIPGTDNQVPEGSLEFRRQFMINNMEANIKIGIEELIIHQNVFPKNERTHWWYWISCYNTGSTNRHSRQWKIYSSKILKRYATICMHDIISDHFQKNCSDLKLYRWYWE